MTSILPQHMPLSAAELDRVVELLSDDRITLVSYVTMQQLQQLHEALERAGITHAVLVDADQIKAVYDHEIQVLLVDAMRHRTGYRIPAVGLICTRQLPRDSHRELLRLRVALSAPNDDPISDVVLIEDYDPDA